MALKSTATKAAPTPVKYSPEAWRENEKQRALMKRDRIRQLFKEHLKLHTGVMEANKKMLLTIGDRNEMNQHLILLAIENAGTSGLPLAKARWFVSDPTELAEAREALLNPKDENGDRLPPKIKEKRGENNELRLFRASLEIETDPDDTGDDGQNLDQNDDEAAE